MGWLDVPALIRGGEFAFENPMIDRDPVPTWVDGPVALLGDAAHAMYQRILMAPARPSWTRA